MLGSLGRPWGRVKGGVGRGEKRNRGFVRGGNRGLHLDTHLAGFEGDGVGLQGFLAAHEIQKLDPRREIGPLDHLAGAHVEPGVMERTLNGALVHQFAVLQRPE